MLEAFSTASMSTKSTFDERPGGVIRVSLAGIAEHIIDALASTNNLNVKMIQDLTNTEIDWDKENRLASIHGDPENVIKAYDDLTGYIRAFMGAIMGSVDYTPTVSASIYGPELARGLCFCLRKPNEAPETSSPQNSPDAKGGGKGFRAFQLYPAHLNSQEKAAGRAISRGLRCSSQALAGGMRGFLIDDVATVLDKHRAKLPSSKRVYIKAEVTIGKNFFLEQDFKKYNLATLKLDIHDFRLMRLGDGIGKVFQRRWVGEWIGKLETLLLALGYKRLGTPQTVIEISLRGERSNGQFYNTVWLASLIPKEGQEVKELKLLESRIELRSCYRADILNGGEKLDMIFESSIYKNEHESACENISHLISSEIRYAPRWGLILDRRAKEERFHPARIFFRKHRKQTKTKWVRGGIIVTLIEEMEGDGRTSYTVKVSNKHLEDLLNSRSRLAPFSEILDAVTEYLNSCDQISSQFQFVEGVFDRNPTEERCSSRDHEVDKRYAPQADPKNRGSQPIAQALRCQTIDNNQTLVHKGMGSDVESGAEVSDPMMDNTNEIVEPGRAGSHGPLVDFLPDLYKARSGQFCDIMGAQDSALPDYPPLLPITPTSSGKAATTSLNFGSAPAGPAPDSSRIVSHHPFEETTNFINNRPKSDASNMNLVDARGTEEIGFGDFLHAPRAEGLFENKPMLVSAGGGENAEIFVTNEAIIVKDGFITDQPTVRELGGPSREFVNGKGLRGVQEGEKLTGTTHGQSTKASRSGPERARAAEYPETVPPRRRFGHLPDAAIADQARLEDHLSTGYGAKSAQRQAESAGAPTYSERSPTPQMFYHSSDCSSTDFKIPIGLGEELCELEEEIYALNEAAGLI